MTLITLLLPTQIRVKGDGVTFNQRPYANNSPPIFQSTLTPKHTHPRQRVINSTALLLGGGVSDRKQHGAGKCALSQRPPGQMFQWKGDTRVRNGRRNCFVLRTDGSLTSKWHAVTKTTFRRRRKQRTNMFYLKMEATLPLQPWQRPRDITTKKINIETTRHIFRDADETKCNW